MIARPMSGQQLTHAHIISPRSVLQESPCSLCNQTCAFVSLLGPSVWFSNWLRTSIWRGEAVQWSSFGDDVSHLCVVMIQSMQSEQDDLTQVLACDESMPLKSFAKPRQAKGSLSSLGGCKLAPMMSCVSMAVNLASHANKKSSACQITHIFSPLCVVC